ncbi:MAG TPA: hypothetical protein VK154_17160 [Chitinophagales bacterium]|nr:hypothetical protein [Chitinophagales bacterium]
MKSRVVFSVPILLFFLVLGHKCFSNGYMPDERINEYPWIRDEFNVNVIVDSIAIMNCVYAKAIHAAAIYSEQYARFERLIQIAKTEQLEGLTKHPNAVVRVYAYKALLIRDKQVAAFARKRLNKDDKKVCALMGCMSFEGRVKQFLKYSLN